MKKFGFECTDKSRFEDWLGYKEQYIYKFENGFGASVIRDRYSYGGPDGQYELAVLRWDGDEYSLAYDTKITCDVCGYLSEEEVRDLLEQIEELPKDHFFDWDEE